MARRERPAAQLTVPRILEHPEEVPAVPRIRIRADASPASLCRAIIRSAGWHALWGGTLMTIASVAPVLLPVALGRAIDEGIMPLLGGTGWQRQLPAFLLWMGCIALLYLLENTCFRFGSSFGWYSVQRAQHELTDRILTRALDPRGSSGKPMPAGKLLALATLDSERACLSLYLAIYPFGDLCAIIVTIGSLFLIHPALGLGALIGAPVLLGIMALVAAPLQRRSVREQEGAADAAGAASDLATGYRVLAGIHAQGRAARRYRGISDAALRATLAARRADAVFSGTNSVLTGLFSAGLIITAALLAFSGHIGIGGFISAAGIAHIALVPMQALIEGTNRMWAVATASAERILELLRTPPRDAQEPPAAAPGSAVLHPVLRFDRVRLPAGILDASIGADELVVLDLDPASQQLIADALMLAEEDEREPIAGSICLHGIPLPQLGTELVRERMLVAPHHPELFDGSIIDNVLPPPDTADPHAHARRRRTAAIALAAARGESMQHKLPGGYDARVGDSGRALSGGQRQRVAIARAIAAVPPVLVLHEPSNSVDSVTESEIASRIKRIRAGKTTIVLSAAPAFHARADRVIRPHPAGPHPPRPAPFPPDAPREREARG